MRKKPKNTISKATNKVDAATEAAFALAEQNVGNTPLNAELENVFSIKR